MVSKIKIDKTKAFIEVEGEEEFVEKIYTEFCSEESPEDYQKPRLYILAALLILCVSFVFFHFYINRPWSGIALGFTAGFIGLIARNLTFMSGNVTEKPGKNLYFSYIAYGLFIVASSLLIFGLLDFYSYKTLLNFYFFFLPLNFYVGLLAYSAISGIDSVLDKLSKLLK